MTNVHVLDPKPDGAPAVLLLHGLGATGASWTLQLPALMEAGFRPLAPDLPGFGRSPYDGRGWSLSRLAKILADILVERGLDSSHVVGLSMGGVLAQQFAHEFPSRTRKLVLVSTFAVLRPDSFSGWFYFLRRFLGVVLGGPQTQARLVAERIFPYPEQEPLRQILLETILQADQDAYRAAMRALAMFDSRPWLSTLTMPTLIISGEDDTTISPAQQRMLAQRIPGAQQVILQAAGHAVPVDQPEVFNRLLLEFLR
ncbi:MAG: alpha/beta hydrolase [Anaerolineales bacterium]|nr:alpha/beta hydrolase [Anaerolineales bacterium]MDW8227254.1 alpha/beta hydrolase [Anaerolineales bacterium]